MYKYAVLLLGPLLLSSCQLSRVNDLSRAQGITSAKIKRTHQSRGLAELIGLTISKLTGLSSVETIMLADISTTTLKIDAELDIDRKMAIEQELHRELLRHQEKLSDLKYQYLQLKAILDKQELENKAAKEILKDLQQLVEKQAKQIYESIEFTKQKLSKEKKLTTESSNKFLSAIDTLEQDLQQVVSGIKINEN